MSELTDKAKSFWSKPEGVTGWIIIGGIGFAVIWFWGLIVPFITLMLESTVKTIILGTIVAGFVAVISDAKYRRALGAIFKGVSRLLTNFIIKIDPLGILKDHIEKLKKYLEDINKQLSIINGQGKKLQLAIQNNNEAIEKNMRMIQAAKERGDVQKANLAISDSTRKQNSNKDYINLLNKINTIYAFLCKMRDNSSYILEDTIGQVDEEERKYETINAASNALGKVKKFFTNDDGLYNDTLASLEENFTQKLGAIDDFMIRSKGLIDNMDLNNDVNISKGIDMFNEWERNNMGFFNAEVTPQLNSGDFISKKDNFNFDYDISKVESTNVNKKTKFLGE